MKEDIKRKVSEPVDQRKKDSFTHVSETWAVATESRRETQEMEGDSKDQDGVHNKEAEQSSKREDDSHVGHVDPKDVITTSIEENNGCEAHDIEEVSMKNDNKEVAMDDMVSRCYVRACRTRQDHGGHGPRNNRTGGGARKTMVVLRTHIDTQKPQPIETRRMCIYI